MSTETYYLSDGGSFVKVFNSTFPIQFIICYFSFLSEFSQSVENFIRNSIISIHILNSYGMFCGRLPPQMITQETPPTQGNHLQIKLLIRILYWKIFFNKLNIVKHKTFHRSAI